MTEQTGLAAKLKELARKNQLDPLGVAPTYRDGCEETEGNIDGWMVCELLRDFKGEPHVEEPFAVGLSRNGADLVAETLNALPQIIAALEARPSPATEGEVERDKELDEAREEGFQEGYSEGQNDANHASKDTFHRVIAWLRKRDLLQDADYPEGYTAEDIADALNEHEENLVSLSKRAALSAARPSREGEMREALEEYLAATAAVFEIDPATKKNWAELDPTKNGECLRRFQRLDAAGKRARAALQPQQKEA